ncbi:unnamed protein product [Fusarium venenatum]|uniref:Uncharacterized protein n=1 Tax=Fusarium venenatum TaxID=56646 RepID=A0A2L2SUK5_9HYPO|nr:uncharacterized protein FVRRES_11946 [Fusarium venenatum]CEI39255.1 unnamed protein product [Fusarium venenatum]
MVTSTGWRQGRVLGDELLPLRWSLGVCLRRIHSSPVKAVALFKLGLGARELDSLVTATFNNTQRSLLRLDIPDCNTEGPLVE